MEEIKIYHRPRRMLLLMAGDIGFVALGIGFIYSYQFTEYAYYQWVAYACIIFFGCASLSILTSAIKEFVFHRPYIIITDEHIIIQKWTPKTINLADVKTFKIAQSIFGGARTGDQEFVAVIYTPEAEQRIKLESGAFGNALRAVNSCLTTQKGIFDDIPTQGTSFSAQELCDMLNERLKKVHHAPEPPVKNEIKLHNPLLTSSHLFSGCITLLLICDLTTGSPYLSLSEDFYTEVHYLINHGGAVHMLLPGLYLFLICYGIHEGYIGLREMLSDKPYLTIGDEYLIVGAKQTVIHFDDVKSFKTGTNLWSWNRGVWREYIKATYTVEAKHRIRRESDFITNAIRTLSFRGGKFELYPLGTGMSGKELCNLLNERLRNYHAKKATP